MAVPVAAVLIPAFAKGVKVGVGATLKYGPLLLDMADQFKRSPGLAPRTGGVGNLQRNGQLLQQLVSGAQVAVASPPPPPLPFNNGPDSWKVPPEIERGIRALVAALQQLGQLWGAPNGTSAGQLPPSWQNVEKVEFNLETPSIVRVEALQSYFFTTTNCETGASTSGGGQFVQTSLPPFPIASFSIPSGKTVTGGSGCGDEGVIYPSEVLSWQFIRTDGTAGEDLLGGIQGAVASPSSSSTHTSSVQLLNVFVDGVELQPPATFVPAGPSTAPLADPEPLAETEIAAAVAAPAPLAVPLLAAQVAGSGTSATGGSGVAGGSLPAAGAVAVPSNPQPNWFGQPATTPGTLPAPLPSVAPTPAFVPRPVPGPSPTGDPVPSPLTEPQPAQVPTTTPAPPTTAPTVPQPGPVAPPLTLPGTVPAPAAVPVTTTAPGTHFPVAGATPVTANGPKATLQEMAREMGRQEQKLSQLLQRSSQPDGSPVDLGEILRLLLQLLDLLNSIDGDGGYEINSPCNVDEETGELLDPLVTQWGTTIGIKGALLKRIDALADLLQFQKELPQPTCKRKKPTGDFVTVNFEQINNDLETP